MKHLTYAYAAWFAQDLMDAVIALDSFKDNKNNSPFTWELKRWSYTDYSEHRFYRKTILIEEEGKQPILKEWYHREGLESIIAELIYENEEI